MWYNNNILIGTLALTVIACVTIYFVPEQSKDVVIPIVTGISGFVSGYVSKAALGGIASQTTTTTEETINAPDKK